MADESRTGDILIPLPYAPRSRHRAWRRWLGRIAIVLAVAVAAVVIGPRVKRHFQARARYKAALSTCLAHSMPASQIVFDESVPRIPVSLYRVADGSSVSRWGRSDARNVEASHASTGTFWMMPQASAIRDMYDAQNEMRLFPTKRVRCARGTRWPADLCDDFRKSSHYEDQSLVFLHGLTNAAGKTKLIELRFDGPSFICKNSRPFYDGLGHPLPFVFQPTDTKFLRLYAGQPDPADRSHFSVRYDLDDEQFVIDGYLRNDGTLRLSDRPTPSTRPGTLNTAEVRPPSPGW